MKTVVNSYDLAEAVNKVSKAIATKPSNQVLEGIKIKAENERLILTATDLEMGIETQIKCEVLEEDEIVVAGKLFTEYANKVSGSGEVELETKSNGQVKFSCGGKMQFVLSTMNATNFPEINKELTEKNSFEIEVSELKNGIAQVSFSSATDEARPILKGCLLEVVEDNKLTMCALDGFRLAMVKKAIKGVNGTIQGIVPARSLVEMSKLIGNNETSVKVYMSKNIVMLKTGETIFTSRLLVGQFVDYKKLLSSTYSTTVYANREELISALDRASILAKLGNNVVGLDITDNELKLSVNGELGNMEESIEVENISKNIEAIYLNYKFLTDCLKAIDEKEIALCVKDKQSPMFVRSVYSGNGNYDYLILPIRVNK